MFTYVTMARAFWCRKQVRRLGRFVVPPVAGDKPSERLAPGRNKKETRLGCRFGIPRRVAGREGSSDSQPEVVIRMGSVLDVEVIGLVLGIDQSHPRYLLGLSRLEQISTSRVAVFCQVVLGRFGSNF